LAGSRCASTAIRGSFSTRTWLMPLPGPKSSTNSFSQYDQPYIDGSYIAANGVNICYYTDDSDLLPHLLDLYAMLHEASQYLSDWGEE